MRINPLSGARLGALGSGAPRRRVVFALAMTTVACLGAGVFATKILAQDDPAAEASADAPARGNAKRKHHAAPKAAPIVTTAEKSRTAAVQDVPAPPPARAGDRPNDRPGDKPSDKPGEARAAFDFAAQLDRAGVSACRAQVNALASSTMASVETFNTMSSWSQTSGDRHPVSIAIGQKYAAGSTVPFGVAQVVAAPNPQGGCDGLTVQVLPSPLSCAKIRDTITARHGQQIGDLAGIALMQEVGVNTMLVPTASDTCVLVATRTAYAK